MKYFSMFSGIGGFELGIEDAYEEKYGGFDGLRCVGYSEINKYANAIYKDKFPAHKNYGNAKELIPEQFPDFDLLVGGFPCQAFSVAGKRGGFDDTRGTLFFDVARVLKVKRPEWFLLENVKGLCSHESGKTLSTIYGVLADLGYTAGWEVVNSCKFGVPQSRERIFIVGHLREAGGRVGEVLPVGESEETNNEKNVQQSDNDIAGSLNTKNNSGQLSVDKGTVLISDSGNSHKFEEQDGIVPTLRKGTASGYHNYVKINKEGNPKNRQDIAACLTGGANSGGNHSDMDLLAIETRTDELRTFKNNIMGTLRSTGDCGDKAVIMQRGRGFNDGGEHELCPPLTSNSFQHNNHLLNTQIRRLTPIECERLQSFPDGWTEYGIMDGEKVEISDTQRYKALGNAVTVNVIKAFMGKMLLAMR